ncbi:MAG TPA: hypothetical protein VGC91_07965 [Pyrinomonadaceae bacterium]|jgi:hypothetical protein
MSVRDIRIGDTIIGNDGRVYRAEDRDDDGIIAEDQYSGYQKTFTDADDIFCVDRDDGIWQEVEG